MDPQETPQSKKPYEKPKLESHRVFEASLACLKVPGQANCAFNFRLNKS